MVCSIECSLVQKEAIRQELHLAMQERFHYHYAVAGLPFILWNIPFYQENHYTCSSYVARVLEKYGVCHWEKHFSLVTPKDFMEKFGRKRIFEGSLRELVEMSVQEETVCAVEKLRNSSVQKEERWLRGYEKENLADSLVSWDYVFDFLYVTLWTESVRNLSGSKNMSVPYLIAAAGLALFLSAQRAA